MAFSIISSLYILMIYDFAENNFETNKIKLEFDEIIYKGCITKDSIFLSNDSEIIVERMDIDNDLKQKVVMTKNIIKDNEITPLEYGDIVTVIKHGKEKKTLLLLDKLLNTKIKTNDIVYVGMVKNEYI